MSSRLIQLFSSAVLISTLQGAENFWDEIPLSPSTTRPAVVLDDYWNGEFQRVNREVAAAEKSQLVFFGDSITWSWSLGPATGKEIWENQLAAFHPINMGNSGDITPVMLHRVTRGNLDFPAGKHPKVAVMLCGINNFIVTKSAEGKETWALGADCPPADIAHGQRAIAQVFRRKLPQTRLIMMALLPVADPAKWEKCQRVNAIHASLELDPNQVAFLDLQDHFLQPDGTPNKAFFTDGIHLSKAGYQVWEKAIAPVIERFTKAPPLAPVKIMFIGGSATEGKNSETSYRRYLDGILRRGGHQIDFIGSRRNHNDDKTEPDSYQFDPDHEGHPGKDSAWLAENIPRLLEKNVPDIAVIHLDADPITNAIDRTIQALRAKNANVKIVIAITTDREGESKLRSQKISQLTFTDFPVVLAEFDQSNTVNSGTAKKIAATLSQVIIPLLPPLKN